MFSFALLSGLWWNFKIDSHKDELSIGPIDLILYANEVRLKSCECIVLQDANE